MKEEDKREVISSEIELCRRCDKRDKRNYYNWTHRQAVVRWAHAIGMEELVREEVEEVKKQVRRDEKDASARHYLEWINSL